MDEHSDEASRQKVIDLIKDIDYALFTTFALDAAAMHSRPMAYRSVEGDGDLWFFTKRDSRKAKEIAADPRTLVAFSDSKNQNFVSLTGTSRIVTDRATVKERWLEIYRTWFPGGPDDEDIVLIRVEPERAEYWDTPSSAMVYAYGYIKAVVTGKPAKPGDVGAVSFD